MAYFLGSAPFLFVYLQKINNIMKILISSLLILISTIVSSQTLTLQDESYDIYSSEQYSDIILKGEVNLTIYGDLTVSKLDFSQSTKLTLINYGYVNVDQPLDLKNSVQFDNHGFMNFKANINASDAVLEFINRGEAFVHQQFDLNNKSYLENCGSFCCHQGINLIGGEVLNKGNFLVSQNLDNSVDGGSFVNDAYVKIGQDYNFGGESTINEINGHTVIGGRMNGSGKKIYGTGDIDVFKKSDLFSSDWIASTIDICRGGSDDIWQNISQGATDLSTKCSREPSYEQQDCEMYLPLYFGSEVTFKRDERQVSLDGNTLNVKCIKCDVSIYTIDAKFVNYEVVTGVQDFVLPTFGIYIVQVDDQSYKVIY